MKNSFELEELTKSMRTTNPQVPDGQARPENLTVLQSAERVEFWKAVFVAVAGSSNVVDPKKPATWADVALQEFDKRFR